MVQRLAGWGVRALALACQAKSPRGQSRPTPSLRAGGWEVACDAGGARAPAGLCGRGWVRHFLLHSRVRARNDVVEQRSHGEGVLLRFPGGAAPCQGLKVHAIN